MADKRKAPSPPPSSAALMKRARGETPPPMTQIAISTGASDREKALVRNVQRTSGLEAPIVSLAGAHSAEIMSCRFDPTGQNVAACSADRTISFWRTYPPNTNYGHLGPSSPIHKGPILDLQWSLNSPHIYTVSADGTLAFINVTTGERIRRLRAHRGVINALDRALTGGTELIATAGDDGFVRVWDVEEEGRDAVQEWEIGCPVTAICWSADASQLFAGALDNEIHVYDLRKQQEVYTLKGHTDTIASLALSPNGQFLLSPSFSSTTLIHDVRPFSTDASRVHRILQGAPAGFENTLRRAAWSRDDGGQRVAVGGADKTVTVWDFESGRVLYKLPGHKGTVTAVDFHPREPIILTGSKDATMLLGELERSLAL
ncbi:unnamed protein product [Rhizoctonia solani]|uniref:Uncharacterized protein n=1 Tax=Rhizoctonia solani TaxID=456999 RepID=A0A8H2Y3C9_9AGAM|nr:unnamed protein product [Rhizoctonia solani]